MIGKRSLSNKPFYLFVDVQYIQSLEPCKCHQRINYVDNSAHFGPDKTIQFLFVHKICMLLVLLTFFVSNIQVHLQLHYFWICNSENSTKLLIKVDDCYWNQKIAISFSTLTRTTWHTNQTSHKHNTYTCMAA